VNKEGFTQRQINGAEVARTLYATLSYPFSILDRHGTVLDLVADVDPVEVFPRWITEGGVHSTGDFCTFDLSLRETFVVPRECVEEVEFFVRSPRVQSTLRSKRLILYLPLLRTVSLVALLFTNAGTSSQAQ
jgi:hypothetical protein